MTALRIRGRVALEATTVWLTGELDMVTAQRLRKTVDVQLDGAPARLVIDVAGLTLLASHGVTCLLEIRDAAYQRGVALELTGLLGNQAVERVVSLLGEWELLLPVDASPARHGVGDAICQNEQRHAGVPHTPAAGLAAGHLRR